MRNALTHVTRTASAAWLAPVVVACTSSPTAPTAPTPGGTVVATARAPRIAITNGTGAPVFTFTVGARAATLINWAPCVDAVPCAPVAPGATTETAYPAASQGTAEQAAVVYWWHAVRGNDGVLRPDSVRAIPVGL
jgi:hypothetical protein